MDLIYTDAKRIDKGVLSAYAFDLSFGADENDFEMSIGIAEAVLEYGAFIYIEGTEYGGIVDGKETSTVDEVIAYKGRTWHGMLNSKVIEPDPEENYFVVSGEANEVLSALVDRLGLSGLFSAVAESSGVYIKRYQFHRYCKGYDGIRDMLAANGAKLKVEWKDRGVVLSAVPVVDYTAAPVDGDIATLTVDQYKKKVNHLICLGRGDLAEREVIHLYLDQFGRIGDVKYFTGLDEIVDTYDNNNSDDLRKDGITKFTELLNIDNAEIDLIETEIPLYDVGDIVRAVDRHSGVSVTAAVTQKIIKINNGAIQTEYKTGGSSATASGGSSSESGGGSNTGSITDIPVATTTTLGAIIVGDNLSITEDGTLSVNTTNQIGQDNTLPITSASVFATVGNIEVLLKTI